MSLRWRDYGEGELLCAAKHPEKPHDSYICDAVHYQLSVVVGVIVPDKNEAENGLWHWRVDDVEQ